MFEVCEGPAPGNGHKNSIGDSQNDVLDTVVEECEEECTFAIVAGEHEIEKPVKIGEAKENIRTVDNEPCSVILIFDGAKNIFDIDKNKGEPKECQAGVSFQKIVFVSPKMAIIIPH